MRGRDQNIHRHVWKRGQPWRRDVPRAVLLALGVLGCLAVSTLLVTVAGAATVAALPSTPAPLSAALHGIDAPARLIYAFEGLFTLGLLVSLHSFVFGGA